jgi:hypothetical protein
MVRITWLTVCLPTVNTQPIMSATKMRKLGALKQTRKRISSIPNGSGIKVFKVAFLLPAFFVVINNGYARNAFLFQELSLCLTAPICKKCETIVTENTAKIKRVLSTDGADYRYKKMRA